MSTRRRFLFVSILTLAVFVILAGLFLFKLEHYGNSDTWWYGVLFNFEYYHDSYVWLHGAITGFFGWLFLILLIVDAFLFYKAIKEEDVKRK